PQPIVHLLFRHFVLTAPGGNTHPACPTLIHPFLPHQPALITRHRRQPPTFVLERLSLGVTTPGRCGLLDAYAVRFRPTPSIPPTGGGGGRRGSDSTRARAAPTRCTRPHRPSLPPPW